MSHHPKISVIVPVYNAAQHIERCARTLFEQTLNDLEYVFVDDCSTDQGIDRLKQIVEEYPERKQSVKIIVHDKNSGVATARNTGLKYASGEYIGWADSDDWVEFEMFEQLYYAVTINNADIVWCDYYMNYPEREERSNEFCNPEPVDCIKKLLSGEIMGAMWNKLVRRSLYDDHHIKFPDGLNMIEDLRVSIEFYCNASKVVYLGNALYHYVQRFNRVTAENLSKTKPNWEWIENVKGIERYLEQKGLDHFDNLLINRKITAKLNIIVQNTQLKDLKKWREIFTETNGKIWFIEMPCFYKLLAWSIEKKFDAITWLLVSIRRLRNIFKRTF
jgi:glycosyltransferase involved in cell wall biosynthesis